MTTAIVVILSCSAFVVLFGMAAGRFIGFGNPLDEGTERAAIARRLRID